MSLQVAHFGHQVAFLHRKIRFLVLLAPLLQMSFQISVANVVACYCLEENYQRSCRLLSLPLLVLCQFRPHVVQTQNYVLSALLVSLNLYNLVGLHLAGNVAFLV